MTTKGLHHIQQIGENAVCKQFKLVFITVEQISSTQENPADTFTKEVKDTEEPFITC